jgi:poly(ADP-ribose) glycohydrolase
MKNPPEGDIELERRYLSKAPLWSTSNKPLRGWQVLREGSISDAENCLHVDFANQCLGGGVICGGCVQEEILFAVNTELIALCLFSESMAENEAIIMRGSSPFSKYSGYAFSLTYAGDYTEEQRPTVIIAIDAVDYRMHNAMNQFQPKHFNRELTKAYVGFLKSPTDQVENSKSIATGKWGCGAFLGNVAFKSLLQYIAASEAERDMVFYTFNDPLSGEMEIIAKYLSSQNLQVYELYNILMEYSNDPKKFTNVFQLIKSKLINPS